MSIRGDIQNFTGRNPGQLVLAASAWTGGLDFISIDVFHPQWFCDVWFSTAFSLPLSDIHVFPFHLLFQRGSWQAWSETCHKFFCGAGNFLFISFFLSSSSTSAILRTLGDLVYSNELAFLSLISQALVRLTVSQSQQAFSCCEKGWISRYVSWWVVSFPYQLQAPF